MACADERIRLAAVDREHAVAEDYYSGRRCSFAPIDWPYVRGRRPALYPASFASHIGG